MNLFLPSNCKVCILVSIYKWGCVIFVFCAWLIWLDRLQVHHGITLNSMIFIIFYSFIRFFSYTIFWCCSFHFPNSQILPPPSLLTFMIVYVHICHTFFLISSVGLNTVCCVCSCEGLNDFKVCFDRVKELYIVWVFNSYLYNPDWSWTLTQLLPLSKC